MSRLSASSPIACSPGAGKTSRRSPCEPGRAGIGTAARRKRNDFTMEFATSELSRADEAFAGNRLLETFSSEARALIEPFGTMIELKTGDVVLRRGGEVKAALFPVGPTMISMTIEL